MDRKDLLDQIRFSLTNDTVRFSFNEFVRYLDDVEKRNSELKEEIRGLENCIVQAVQALSPMKDPESPAEYYRRTKAMAQEFLNTRRYFNILKD
jgi:cell division septum initiation protein DivIVA